MLTQEAQECGSYVKRLELRERLPLVEVVINLEEPIRYRITWKTLDLGGEGGKLSGATKCAQRKMRNENLSSNWQRREDLSAPNTRSYYR